MKRDYWRDFVDNLPLFVIILFTMSLFGCLNGPLGGQ